MKSSSVHQLRAFWVPGSWAQLLWQWSPTFLAAGAALTEDSSSVDWGAGRVVSERSECFTFTAHFVSSLLSQLIWQEGQVRGLEAGGSWYKGPPVACENTLYTTKMKHSTCKQSRDVLTTRGDLDWQASSNGRKYLSASTKFAFGGAAAPSLKQRGPERGNELKKLTFATLPHHFNFCSHLQSFN